ncbi:MULTISPECIES: DUF4387 family protein [Falsihalocynthiibacter]|uniref:DUF4387 domain-containing protein n=1 Tax=Falsihalocynthiibacter arcticus TaxID=1579316 RepID=A0A126UVF7_9RHOB|nr:DUF4387 family protein [Falsihalocynthiibacter arcticus]AML50030.1 hypothetical protein RC74_00910 [Falsihalocynthiibacter arcticus]
MAELRDIAYKIRSKNAGPFWLTVDIFCGNGPAFTQICNGLSTQRVASVFGTKVEDIKRFEIPDLNVIKFSMPRPSIQGAVEDRDMHGASWAALLAETSIN